MKVFISYSSALDQIIALRLQTMAAVYGIASYVPPATTRQPGTPHPIPEVLQNLQESDVVLGVITHTPAASALDEMNWAVEKRKLLIPIIGPGVAPEHYRQFQPYFIVDPADPSQAEQQIAKFLAQKQQAETAKNALIALATLTVALLLLGSLASES